LEILERIALKEVGKTVIVQGARAQKEGMETREDITGILPFQTRLIQSDKSKICSKTQFVLPKRMKDIDAVIPTRRRLFRRRAPGDKQ